MQVFSPEAKERALAIVGVIRETVEERLKTVSWMKDETKVKALEKLQRFGGKTRSCICRTKQAGYS